jgi:deoxyribodipyrimidine photolyase-like uncharacterized protein
MDIVSEVNPIDGTEDLYKDLALQILKRFLLEKHKEYCRNYYQNNREKLIQANMRHFKENYRTISQTERYKQTAKKSITNTLTNATRRLKRQRIASTILRRELK